MKYGPSEHMAFIRAVNRSFEPVKLKKPYPRVRGLDYKDGFGVQNKDGVVRFWIQGEWQNLPNDLWGWWLVPASWFDDQNPADLWTPISWYDDYDVGTLWVPKLLSSDCKGARRRPSRSPLQVATSNTSTWRKYTAKEIAPMLFQHLQTIEDRRSAKTSRLVCRDWASACPVREPKDCNWRVEDGVVWHWIEAEWRVLPSTSWAWTLGRFSDEWWVEERCHQQYFPKLMQPIDDSVGRNSKYPSTLSLPLSLFGIPRRPSFPTVAAELPPELFKYICNAADSESWSSRLVCPYWNRVSTPRVFDRIDVKLNPERVRELWKRRTDPVMRHVKVVENVPDYAEKPKFPWIHLLTQACTSTKSVWTSGRWASQGRISIQGTSTGGHRTIRSVHFALPRSLPRSLSRGIKDLVLDGIHFRRFEDLIHLACELPDLEVLNVSEGSFDSLPIELPHRRPRTNRNKLRYVSIINRKLWDLEPVPAVTLYLSVYDVASFFSEGDLAVILPLAQVSHRLYRCRVHYRVETGPSYHFCELSFSEEFLGHGKRSSFVSLRALQETTQNSATLQVIVDYRNRMADEDLDRWTRFNSEFNKINSQTRQIQCIFGFADRKQMVHFAATILEKMPSVSRLATLRYSIYIDYDRENNNTGGWRRASLDSEELTGTAEHDLAEVYS